MFRVPSHPHAPRPPRISSVCPCLSISFTGVFLLFWSNCGSPTRPTAGPPVGASPHPRPSGRPPRSATPSRRGGHSWGTAVDRASASRTGCRSSNSPLRPQKQLSRIACASVRSRLNRRRCRYGRARPIGRLPGLGTRVRRHRGMLDPFVHRCSPFSCRGNLRCSLSQSSRRSTK